MTAKSSKQAPSRRRLARLAAVQALYQADLGEGDIDGVIQEFLAHRLEEEVEGVSLANLDRVLFSDLAKGVAVYRDELDEIITPVLDPDWPLPRLERLVRIILRCGAFELWQKPDIPARVAINEYVELAKAFFSGSEPAFINGVLDRAAHTLRKAEFGANAAETD